jgi:glycine dehydrogenase subunit 2
MEMTRFSLEQLTEDTGIGVHDVAHRMVDYGLDAFWESHHPWLVPEPFTPEPGEMYGKEDLDFFADVIAQVCEEAYTDPDLVRTAPHNHPIHRLDARHIEEPSRWATTWRSHLKKSAALT